MLSEFRDNGWKAGSIDNLLKRIHNMVRATSVWQPDSGRPHIRCVAVDDLVHSQVDKLKRHRSAPEISQLPFSVQVHTG